MDIVLGSRKNRSSKKGFTLIELMIVVAIIGILAAVAIPKFADMVQKSRDAATKGNLGAIRSAITIYYSDTEGEHPTDLTALTDAKKYINNIPIAYLRYHPDTNDVMYGP